MFDGACALRGRGGSLANDARRYLCPLVHGGAHRQLSRCRGRRSTNDMVRALFRADLHCGLQ